MKKTIPICLVSILLLSLLVGCAVQIEQTVPTETTPLNTSTESADPTETALSDEEMFTDRDRRTTYDEADAVHIMLQGSTATATSDAVKISGSTVTLTEAATYVLTGTLTDGMIIVDADKSDKLQLVLSGVDITNVTSAAIYVKQADKVFLTLAEGTANALANGGTFEAIDENNIDAVLFSKDDLTLNGSGSLMLTSPGGHGITCKDDLVFTGGTYIIGAASHGLDANDSIRITGETALTVTAGKDAIHCEHDDGGYVYLSGGTFCLQAEGDGISAGSDMTILDGTFEICTGGGSANAQPHTSEQFGGRPTFRADDNASTGSEETVSTKAIKAENQLTISGGTFSINSADDGVHSNGSILISGGVFQIATGDDGMHADESMTVTDGVIDITESYEGLEALHLTISGGTIRIVSTDDGLNAAGGTDASGFGGRDGGMGGMSASSDGTIVISGGNIEIKASGDGIDANGTLEISSGHIVVTGPTQGDTATLDFDKTGTITGGTFIGTGASMMAQTFSSSTQGVISLSVGNRSAGTKITLRDAEGNVLVEHSPELDFAIVILSTPEMISGETYTVTIGEDSGEFQAN